MHRLKTSSRVAAILHHEITTICAILLAVLTIGFSHAAWAETLSWDTRPTTTLSAGQTDTATVNGVTILTSGTSTGTFDSRNQQILPTTSLSGITGYIESFMDATADNESSTQTVSLTFSEPVYNVSFVVADIDGGVSFDDGTNRFTDIVEFRANGSVLPTSGTPFNSSRVSWASTTGRATSIYNANVSDSSGSITIFFAGPVNSLTIKHIAGNAANTPNPTTQAIGLDDITFTRSPRLTLRKTSVGGVATFNFSATNGPSGTFTTNVTTTVPGTPVTGTQNRLGTVNVATTVTETGPAGWLLSSPATCTDANSANSGNPASFTATVSSSAFVIPATNVRAGAELTCSLTNTKLPTLQLRKISNGGTRSFDFSANNGFGTATVTTTVIGSPASIPARTLANFSTSTTISETIPPDFILTNISCTGIGSGAATNNLTAGTVTLDAVATAPGHNIICTYTNERPTPALTIDKTANLPGPVSVGDTITYTYRITNAGNTSVNNINISETFNGTGSVPVPQNEIILTDNPPSGDSTDTVSNNGVWSQLAPGDVIRFIANYTVLQSDIDQLQ